MSSRKSTTKRKSSVNANTISSKKHSLTGKIVTGLTLKPNTLETLSPGSVFTCGQNDVGQLGIGEDESERKKPTIVKQLTDIVDICAGGMHTLCIDRNGRVYSWGCNDDFALGRETTSETEAIPGEVSIEEKVVQVTAGDSHSAALTESGKVYAWGSFRDSHGVMGLTSDGKQKVPTLIMNNAAKIASGTDHLLILSTNGSLYSSGCAEQGQLGRISVRFADRGSRRGLGNLLNPGLIPHPKTKFDEIWTGSWHSFAKEHHTSDIYSFGLNNYFQLGLSDFEVYTWPEVSKAFSAARTWVSICGGQHHTLALDNRGKTYVLGRKDYGRLGLGEESDDIIKEPTIIPSLEKKKVISICCGSSVSFAVTSEGEAYGWGFGTNYQVGNDTEDDVYEPKLITGKQIQDYKIIKVASGGQHTVFLAQKRSS
ncbi:regulator of chromosome condensation-like isoform X1 [Planococcus citri]|uniref:regulator of chromosome condensation-like isoform X1 n=1 Tax=Planococcus citri TaxID=170843 RepID=UPI0031F7A93E